MVDFRKSPTSADGHPLVRLDGPTNADGKPVFVTSPGREVFSIKYQGRDDDEVGVQRGLGNPFQVTFAGDETAISGGFDDERYEALQEFSFLDPIEIHEGFVSWTSNFNHEDELELYLKLEATSATETPGTGNANVVEGYLLVPANGDGSHTVDLGSAVPIPATPDNGFWDVDPQTGAIVASPTPGQAKFHLLLVPAPNQYLLDRIPLLDASRRFIPQPDKPQWFHQNWILCLRVTTKVSKTGTVGGMIKLYRSNVGR